jgi:hypothetical protein
MLAATATPAAPETDDASAQPVVTVTEGAGVARKHWPITFGFPFRAGSLTDPAKVFLEDASGGGRLAVQNRVLSRWPDGSVRWLQLDAGADLAPRQTRKFRVRIGDAPRRSHSGVRVSDSAAGVEIDTGRLRFIVPKTRLALLDAVHLDGAAAAGGAVTSFLRATEERGVPPAPASVRIVENGHQRARVEIRGEYVNRFRYVIRIDAFAGQPFVRVLHTFENHGDLPYAPLRQLAVDIPLDLEFGAAYTTGLVHGAPLKGRVPEGGADLLQLDNETLSHRGKKLAARGAGWADLYDGKRGVAVAARYFWQEYPQAFSFQSSGLTYEMWAASAMPAVVGMGAAKTHELVIAFHGGSQPSSGEMDALVAPLVAVVDAQWLRDSKALPQALAPGGRTRAFLSGLIKSYERYRATNDKEAWDDSGQVTCASGEREVRRRGAYGMWNWGDWNFPGYHDSVKGCDAWGNQEYDLTQVLALGFAATGERALFDGLVAAARHFMDVDRIHHQRVHPSFVGMNHPKNPLHFTFEMGGVDLGHTWNEGLLSYYYLTGDERGRDAALGIADYLEARVRKGNVRGNPRQWGWPQIALSAAFEATLDERYRAAAAAYARGGMRAHPPAAGHWKFGILADTLAYTHALAADAALRREIEEWLTSYSRAAAGAGVRDARFFPAIAYVAKLGGKAAEIDAARAAADRLQFGAWGKPFTLAGRIGFRILSLTEGATATEDSTLEIQN